MVRATRLKHPIDEETSMLHGKTAVVTGSTSGIGLGIATALAAQGCAVMLNCFGERAAIEQAKRDVARHGTRVAYSAADMAKPAQIREMIAEAKRELGGVDILVNNAGIQHVAPVAAFPEEKWDAIIAVNLSAAFHATKAALPLMKERRWGRIINISSAHGLVASAMKAAYVAAKHGIIGLTKVTALEVANDGITCNAICPGWVLTPLVEKQVEARAKETGQTVEQAKTELLREKQPMLAFTTPVQLAELAVFLCGPGAATMTGAALSMDGGWVAQ
jgi:3-hydroxybutyrate dehydrogenase